MCCSSSIYTASIYKYPRNQNVLDWGVLIVVTPTTSTWKVEPFELEGFAKSQAGDIPLIDQIDLESAWIERSRFK
jgi:hypothetical protein